MPCGSTTAGRHVCIIHECKYVLQRQSAPAISHSLGWHCGGAPPSKAALLVQCDRAGERKVDMLDTQLTSGAFAVEVSGDQQYPPQPPAPQPTHTAQNIRLGLDEPRVRFGSDTRQGNW